VKWKKSDTYFNNPSPDQSGKKKEIHNAKKKVKKKRGRKIRSVSVELSTKKENRSKRKRERGEKWIGCLSWEGVTAS